MLSQLSKPSVLPEASIEKRFTQLHQGDLLRFYVNFQALIKAPDPKVKALDWNDLLKTYLDKYHQSYNSHEILDYLHELIFDTGASDLQDYVNQL